MHFSNYLGRGFNIPEYKGNTFLDPKTLVGSFGDTLLRFKIYFRFSRIQTYRIVYFSRRLFAKHQTLSSRLDFQ